MTSNQIRYAQHLEGQRHNVASEEIERKKAAHQGTQAEAAMKQAETAAFSAREGARHNRATETLESTKAAQDWWNKQATLEESSRHNRSTEQIQGQQADATLKRASAEERKAAVQERQQDLSEWYVPWQVYDAETRRIQANTGQAQVALGRDQLAEQVRHAGVMEGQGSEQIKLGNLTSDRNYWLGLGSLREDIRHHTTDEDIKRKDSKNRNLISANKVFWDTITGITRTAFGGGRLR